MEYVRSGGIQTHAMCAYVDSMHLKSVKLTLVRFSFSVLFSQLQFEWGLSNINAYTKMRAYGK